MKKYFMLALVAIFTVSMTLNAQNQRPQGGQGGQAGEQRTQATPKERAARLAKQLKLSDAETTKVEAYYEKMDKAREAARADMKKAGKNADDRKAKLEAQRSADDAELLSIIGQEKMDKYLKMRAERDAKIKDRGQGQGQGKRGNAE